MSLLQQCIAVHADQREVIELAELVRHAALTKEQRLAVLAPTLEVIGIRGVLDESDAALMHLDVMPANDR